MAKISRMYVGQTLYEVRRQRMGNTTVSCGVLYMIKITEIDPAGEWVMASWNNNPSKKNWQRQADKWRVSKPAPRGERFGVPNY